MRRPPRESRRQGGRPQHRAGRPRRFLRFARRHRAAGDPRNDAARAARRNTKDACPKMIGPIVLALILAKWAAELWLSRLNERHVRSQGNKVPEAFKDTIDQATYVKSVRYTLAKTRLGQIEDMWGVVILLVVLFSGVLPWAFHLLASGLGESAWTMAGFLFVTGVALALAGLPFDWYVQFRLGDQFGLNTSTRKFCWLTRFKHLLFGLVMGYPMLVLVWKLIEGTGTRTG